MLASNSHHDNPADDAPCGLYLSTGRTAFAGLCLQIAPLRLADFDNRCVGYVHCIEARPYTSNPSNKGARVTTNFKGDGAGGTTHLHFDFSTLSPRDCYKLLIGTVKLLGPLRS